MPDSPLAYFITFSCYGTWLHGRAPGSVDREHNQPGTPFIPGNEAREQKNQQALRHPPYLLDGPRRKLVLQAIQNVCAHRNWVLLAAHVRTNHVHVIVQAPVAPEKVMNDFKAYASRSLNESGLDPSGQTRWTRHGSTLYLWSEGQVETKVRYVVDEQGDPLEVFQAVGVRSEARAGNDRV